MDDGLGRRLVRDRGDDMRARLTANGRALWKLHKSVPRCPAADPLPRLLDREDGGPDHAPIAGHELNGADATFRREAKIDRRAPHSTHLLITFHSDGRQRHSDI